MLTKRKDGRYVKKKIIAGRIVYFYSSEPTEKKALKDIESQMLNYTEREERGKLMKDVCEEWLSHKFESLRYQSLKRYTSYTNRIIEHLGDMYIKDLEISDVERVLLDMKQNLFSSKTISEQLNIIKMIFKYSYMHNYIKDNICLYITAPKGKDKVERKPISKADSLTITVTKDSNIFEKLFFLILYTGLRKGEALALTYGDIDYDNNLININKSLEFRHNVPCVGMPKTQKSIRKVPLPEIVKNIIPKQNHSDNDIIFPNHEGHYMHETYYQRNWKTTADKFGIKATAHQLRHTYCTQLFEWDIQDKVIQTIMGHSDITTTRNIYTHIRENMYQSTIDKINDSINKM